jgi:hypothetical protein
MNFGMKQTEFLAKNTIQKLREGKPDEAAKFAAQYVVLTGGLTGVVMEARDAIFKGEWSEDGYEFGDFSAEDVPQRAQLVVLSNMAAGLLPHNQFGMNMFLHSPFEQFVDDRGTIMEVPKAVYENLRDLNRKGSFPTEIVAMSNPFGREMARYTEYLWKETEMGQQAQEALGVDPASLLQKESRRRSDDD